MTTQYSRAICARSTGGCFIGEKQQTACLFPVLRANPRLAAGFGLLGHLSIAGSNGLSRLLRKSYGTARMRGKSVSELGRRRALELVFFALH